MHHAITRAAAILAGSLLASGALAERPRIPNEVKYKDSSIANARGRSGSASIEARALLGKDGRTVIDVTTGSLDGTTAAPGNIERVQVKIPTGGDPITLNHNHLTGGGTFSTTVEDAFHGDTLSLQAWVTGIDPNRTDVVSVDEVVKLRPDLAVLSVSAVPHALIGMPASVAATVVEKNGEVGARGDCVLYADNVEVRRAPGIWVDAGGTVTCSFMTTFDTAGPRQLRVAVEQVSPGDYDTANNSAAGQTHVYATADEFPEWYTTATELFESFMFHQTTSTSDRFREQSEFRQTNVSYGVLRGPVNIPSFRITGTVETDGELLYSAENMESELDSPPPWFDSPGWLKFWGDHFDGHAMAFGFGADQFTQVMLRRIAGDVTYREEGWESSPAAYYTFNTDESTHYGGPIPRRFGETVSFKVTASDGTNMWIQDQSQIQMQPFSSADIIPWSCFTHRFRGVICTEQRIIQEGTHGYDDQTRH